ncbi:hypothetical protein BGZ99_008597, partial [Dissophora globulifera]
EGSSSRPWKMVPPLVKSSPLLDRVQKKPDIRPCLREFRRRRLLDQEQRNALYIPPQAKASRERPDDELFDLTSKVNEFLAGDQKVLLIMGDSGAGKSTFNLELECSLWDAYDKDKKRIPLLVTLPAIDKPEQDLIAKHLRRYDFNEEQIRELKSYHEFILICDGYDECQQKGNLYTSNRLNQPGEWNAQMVISCRSEYLGHDYRFRFQPGDRNNWTGAALLQEAVIVPFSENQVRHYIITFVVKNAPRWRVTDYLQAFDRIPGLKSLVTNPFLLTLSVSVLPDMVDLGDNLSSIKVTRVALYDKFMEQWVGRGMVRLQDKKLSENDREAFEDLCSGGFSQNAIRFTKDLSVAIFENQNGAPVVEYSPFHDTDKWQHAFFSHIDGKNLLREACPIIRIGSSNQYRFIHRSVLEYGLARAVFEPLQRGREEQSNRRPAGSVRQQWSMNPDSEAEHEASVANELIPNSTSPLCQRSFVKEPSILQFLAERVQQEPIFKKELLFYIKQSKLDKGWDIPAANAITILVKAGIRFNGEDLKGIQIPGADLSGGEFDSAQLQGADLRRATLCNVWLRQADLGNAQMEGVDFGEQPYLTEQSLVQCCTFSPNGMACAVSLDHGEINIYDTSTWTKTYTLQGHRGPVKCVVYSPNGQQIATGSFERTVRLWDAETGAPGLILSGHTGWVLSVVYSPSGQQIASGSSDGTVRLWDAQTGSPGFILSDHTSWVKSVAYSPSGHQIASGSWDSTVQLWDAQTGALGLTLKGHTHGVNSVVYSPSGQQIASGSDDATVRLWDAQTGAPGLTLRGDNYIVTSVAYSPSGQQIASGSYSKTVRLWDTQTGAPGSILSGHTRDVTSVAYSPNSQQIASSSVDKTVRLWDAQAGAHGLILGEHTSGIRSIAYSPSGQQIASGSSDGTVQLWDAQTGAQGPILSGHTDRVSIIAYSPSGHQIASSDWGNTVRLWDTQTGAPGPILSGHTNKVWSVAYSPSGHQIATGSFDKTVRLWDAQTGSPGSILSGHTGCVLSVVFSPSGQQIASGSDDDTVWLWNTRTGANDLILRGHTSSVENIAYSPSGQQIASASYDEVRLWDAQTGAPGPIISDFDDEVRSVMYSPSGHQIAMYGEEGPVWLWDAQTGAPGPVLSGHIDIIRSVVYSPSGQQIVSSSEDETVRVWDVDSGRCLAALNDFHGLVTSIAWDLTPNSSCFVTGCRDGSISKWQVIDEEGHYNVRLQWSTMHDKLAVSNTSLRGVQGLSRMNIRLLEQRGAVGRSIPLLSFEMASKMLTSIASVALKLRAAARQINFPPPFSPQVVQQIWSG